MKNPILPNHQVDHLILLVGGNPLPNAVSGKLLVKRGGQISLIYSKETSDVATKLNRWFRREQKIHSIDVEVDAASPNSVRKKIHSLLKGQAPECVGLNYTGGTKTMAVHAYQSVKSWCDQQRSRFISSYLDAQSLRLIIEENGESSNEYAPYCGPYVGRVVEPKLDHLLDMHQWMLSSPTRKAILPQTARSLSLIHSQTSAQQKIGKWRNWKKAILKKCRPKPGSAAPGKKMGRWKEEDELREILIEFPEQTGAQELQIVFNKLRHELDLGSETFAILLGAIADKQACKAVDICEWIDGKWLEHDCLNLLQAIQAELKLQDCVQNVFVKGKLGGYPEFEIDVVALRGYQLYAFSCSTDGRWSLMKSKLFEAYIRARQIGGDEARVALVCPSDTPQELQNQVEQDMNLDDRIHVFGRPHLSNLKEELRKWIENQCKEPMP